MSIDVLGPGALDYLPCRYGASKLLFRGPKRTLDQPYIAFIGGTETYGKFIQKPFPALVEAAMKKTCVNFGFLNAGVDVFVRDPFVLDAANKADVTVIQVMGAQNMTNRFYSVHPRRNDRFIAASQLLGVIYREVDFSEYHFTRHMLSDLMTLSADRFEAVRSELQQAWLARMRLLLAQITGKTVLVWFAENPPSQGDDTSGDLLGSDPLFITRQMLDELAPLVTETVVVEPSTQAMDAGTEGMVFSELETVAAQQMLGPQAHAEAAEAIIKTIAHM